jgi:glycosyltransferase involved in cell wall biosynthesis
MGVGHRLGILHRIDRRIMKILLIIYGSIQQVSGGYLYDRVVVSALRERGDSVDILKLKKYPYLCAPVQSLGPKLRNLFAQARSHYDCIVVDELVHPSLPFLVMGAARKPPFMVTLVHHLKSSERVDPFVRLISRTLEKHLIKNSHMLVVNSRTTQEVVGRLAKRSIPIVICRPGKDTLGFKKKTQEQSRSNRADEHSRTVHVLMVGNLIRRKGHDFLLRALVPLRDKDWRLTVVGSDTADRRYTKRLFSFIQSSGLGGKVCFVGTVSDETLAQLYQGGDFFVFPSEYEGYGIALAEALSFGLPYIALDSGALGEITVAGSAENEKLSLDHANAPDPSTTTSPDENRIDGEVDLIRRPGGFLIRGRKGELFSKALEALISDGRLRAEMSQEAHALSRSLPSWKETGECFYRALHQTFKSHVCGNR